MADSLNPHSLGPKRCRGAGRPGAGFVERCRSGQLLWLGPPLNFGDSGCRQEGLLWQPLALSQQQPGAPLPPPKPHRVLRLWVVLKLASFLGLGVVVAENGVCAELISREPSPALSV